MVLRFLGESVTDSNGLAVLPDGYTGTGAGEIDVVAKTEIDDSSLQSEPYQVLDTKFKDLGSNNKWWYTSANGSLSHNNDETTLEFTGSSSYCRTYPYLVDTLPSSWADKEEAMRWITTDVAIEFDLITVNGSQISIRFDTGNGTKDINSPNLSNVNHIKIELKNGYVYWYLDGAVQPNPTAFTYSKTSVSFYTDPTKNLLTFKNFVIYPI